MHRFLSPPMVGLDIQPYGIRLIQLRKTGKGFLAECASKVPLAKEIFEGGKIRQFETVQAQLHEQVVKLGLAGMATAIQIPADLVRMQQMQFPAGMAEAAINTEIKVQLARDFPGLGDSLFIDFNIERLNQSAYSNVYFVVTRQEYVTQYVHCINATGLKVKVVDVDWYALKRVFRAASWEDTEGVHALVCEIKHVALLIIYSGHEIIFHQQWISETENDFLSVLKNHLTIFIKSFPDKILRKLVICSQYQQEKTLLNCPVEYHTPFKSITLSRHLEQQLGRKDLSDYLLACGLAMREVPKW